MPTVFGTEPYTGLRWSETVAETRRTLTSPANFVNAPLPDGTLTSTESAAAAGAFVRQAGNTYINTSSWSSLIYVVDDSTPVVPVTIANPPSYKQQLAAVLSDGVPIPADAVVESDSDAELVIYHPGRDKLWELWRASKHADGSWWCSDGGRMSYVSTSPGHWRSRTNGAVYPTLNDSSGRPLSAAKRDTFEVVTWGATAAKLPLLELMVTGEDLTCGVIGHALGVACDPRYIAPGKRWPAQGYDGYTAGAPLQGGMRFRLPAGFVVSTALHPVCQMIAAAARDFGLVLWDRSGSLSFRGTPDVHDHFDGTAPSQVLAGFPWADLQVLATGSDSVPNPTV